MANAISAIAITTTHTRNSQSGSLPRFGTLALLL
jgi:hypothetical protein